MAKSWLISTTKDAIAMVLFCPLKMMMLLWFLLKKKLVGTGQLTQGQR